MTESVAGRLIEKIKGESRCRGLAASNLGTPRKKNRKRSKKKV